MQTASQINMSVIWVVTPSKLLFKYHIL
jgi:hypothetical protein